MKTQLLVLALITTVFSTQIQGQNRTIVNAQNSEISDNLDLRVVASIFGDSRNLQDFEKKLNDPKLQISNLDLNNDGQVDYLRVIETVEKRTHIVVIQSIIDRDVYQDVATIEVEKNWKNNIQIQVVGNSYFYGQNYIYEPIYYSTPLIYAGFWITNYKPYYSNWCWNNYPNYYWSWNTYPVFRYRNNVNNCLNNYSYNSYNYVNYRRSSYYSNRYNNYCSNGYERQHPEYSFSRRNATVNNRYELDQIRNTRYGGTRNGNGYSHNRIETQKETTPQRSVTNRDNSQNRSESTREIAPQRAASQRDYTQTRTESTKEIIPQRTATQRDYSQTRTESTREIVPQRTASQRDYSQTRTETSPQKLESIRENNSSRNPSSNNNTNFSRSSNRRT
jgi:hypothetical protein